MRKKMILLISSIMLVIIILISSSYALLFRVNETEVQSYQTGTLEITSTAANNSVTLSNAIPMSDSEGQSSTPYVFTITNTGNLSYKFNVLFLSTTTTNQISSSYIKIKVDTESVVTLNTLSTRSPSGLIKGDVTLAPGESLSITLRVWLAENTPNSEIGKVFNAKITTEGEAVYTEESSGDDEVIENTRTSSEMLTLLGLTVKSGTPDFDSTSPKTVTTTTSGGYTATEGSSISSKCVNSTVSLCGASSYTINSSGKFEISCSSTTLSTSYPYTCSFTGSTLKSCSTLYKVTKVTASTSTCSSSGEIMENNKNINSSQIIPVVVGEEEIGGNAIVTPSTGSNTYTYKTLTATASEGTTTETLDYTETGVYAADDDLGTSYYFRGAVENNWVYFAGIYWRIIRINGDGSIRMIYSGTTAPTSSQKVVMTGSGTYVTTSEFNSSFNDNKYVGYTYDNNGTETDSTIKNYIENTWYANTLLNTEYEQYLADAIYCNDREISTNSTVYSGWGSSYDSTSATLGQGTTPTIYKSEERLGNYATPRSPSLKCSQDSDKYTKSTSLGNGKLKYKVGLITADEIAMAGGRSYNSSDSSSTYTNMSFYLYTLDNYWSLTPSHFYGNTYVWGLYAPYLQNGLANNPLGIRPVISIASGATISGSGTYSNPFTIS